jgi:hypothetical protein
MAPSRITSYLHNTSHASPETIRPSTLNDDVEALVPLLREEEDFGTEDGTVTYHSTATGQALPSSYRSKTVRTGCIAYPIQENPRRYTDESIITVSVLIADRP